MLFVFSSRYIDGYYYLTGIKHDDDEDKKGIVLKLDSSGVEQERYLIDALSVLDIAEYQDGFILSIPYGGVIHVNDDFEQINNLDVDYDSIYGLRIYNTFEDDIILADTNFSFLSHEHFYINDDFSLDNALIVSIFNDRSIVLETPTENQFVIFGSSINNVVVYNSKLEKIHKGVNLKGFDDNNFTLNEGLFLKSNNMYIIGDGYCHVFSDLDDNYMSFGYPSSFINPIILQSSIFLVATVIIMIPIIVSNVRRKRAI